MNEKQYYLTAIKVASENAKGRIKYRRDLYVCEAVSPTDVEKKMSTYLETADYEIVQITASKILDIIK